MLAFLTLLGGMAKTWLEGKVEIKKAETQARVATASMRVEAEVKWDDLMARASQTSWKDEWWTILISIPLVMAFVPSMVPYVSAGFAVLNTMPEWYMLLLSVAFAAAFGVRSVVTAFERLTKLRRP